MNQASIETAFKAMELFEEFRPLLQGKPRELQGAVLIQCLGLWVAGHHPDLREGALESILTALPGMIEISEFELFGPEGLPGAYQKEECK